MSKEARVVRIKSLYELFQALTPRSFDSFEISVSDFDGLDLVEAKKAMRFVLDTMDKLFENEAFGDLPWHMLTTVEGQLQNVYNSLSQLRSNRDQSSFQNFASNLDSFVYHIRMFGLSYLASGGHQLEKTSVAISDEFERLARTRSEIEQLRNEVKALIEPAVAGSLSEAFTARKDVLLYGRIAWGVVAVAAGAYCIYSTYAFANAVSQAILDTRSAGLGSDALWPSILLRSVVLLPLYAAFGFAFSQYKKERDFEEEYAHKAAVAASLPNYGDLAREPAVRDQIVTGATSVIFTAPTKSRESAATPESVLSPVKDLLDSVGKLLPKQ